MQRCPELSKLTKAKSVKSINFRYTTPGSPGFLLSPSWQPLHRQPVVDPSHPAVFIPRSEYASKFPDVTCDAFNVRAYPKAMLLKPEMYWPDPPYGLDKRLWKLGDSSVKVGEGSIPVKVDRFNMSMLCVTGKKILHKKAVIRKKVVNRLKIAMGLIVTRGAAAREMGRRPSLVFKEDATEERKLILQNWTYIFWPSLSVYRMPYPKLVDELRKALHVIWTVGHSLEEQWCELQLRKTGETREAEANGQPDDVRHPPEKSVVMSGTSRADLLQSNAAVRDSQTSHQTGYELGPTAAAENDVLDREKFWSRPYNILPIISPRLSAILRSSAGEDEIDRLPPGLRFNDSLRNGDANTDVETIDASVHSPPRRHIPPLYFPPPSLTQPTRSSEPFSEPSSSRAGFATDPELAFGPLTVGNLDVKNPLVGEKSDEDRSPSSTAVTKSGPPREPPISPGPAPTSTVEKPERSGNRLFQRKPLILPQPASKKRP